MSDADAPFEGNAADIRDVAASVGLRNHPDVAGDAFRSGDKHQLLAVPAHPGMVTNTYPDVDWGEAPVTLRLAGGDSSAQIHLTTPQARELRDALVGICGESNADPDPATDG